MMDISVIIPCYNLEDYIERCLKSVLSQDYDSGLFEIIVIIDSCTDNSEKIVRKLLANRVQDKIITVKYNRAGLSRNCGLECATGKYIWFIDGDDYLIDMQAFSKLVALMNKTKATVGYLREFISGKAISEKWATWRFFYERNFLGNMRFSNKIIDEDLEFFSTVCKKSDFRIVQVGDKMYYHEFPRKGSIVTEFNK